MWVLEIKGNGMSEEDYDPHKKDPVDELVAMQKKLLERELKNQEARDAEMAQLESLRRAPMEIRSVRPPTSAEMVERLKKVWRVVNEAAPDAGDMVKSVMVQMLFHQPMFDAPTVVGGFEPAPAEPD